MSKIEVVLEKYKWLVDENHIIMGDAIEAKYGRELYRALKDAEAQVEALQERIDDLIEAGGKLRGDSGTHAMQTYNQIAADHCDEWDALLKESEG